jgi:hypothetical protein
MDANTYSHGIPKEWGFVSDKTSDWNKLALAIAHGRSVKNYLSVKDYLEASYEDSMGREAEERTLREENIKALYLL